MDFKDVFPKKIPGLQQKHGLCFSIELNLGLVLASKAPYCMSALELVELEIQLQELIEKACLQPSVFPWREPILFIKKKDDTLRMCIDYHELIEMTINNPYPLFRIKDLFDQVGGEKIFSNIDLRSKYHHVWICNEDTHKKSFRT